MSNPFARSSITLALNFFHLFFMQMSSNLDQEENFLRLTNAFANPDSTTYLDYDFMKTARKLNRDATRHPISPSQAQAISEKLSLLSKMKERRILRGAARKISTRPWKSFSPCHVNKCPTSHVPITPLFTCNTHSLYEHLSARWPVRPLTRP